MNRVGKKDFWNSTPIKVAIHLTAWLCLLLFPYLSTNQPEADKLFPKFLFNTVLLIIFYYTNVYVFIPRLLTRERLLAFAGAIVSSIALIIFAQYLFDIFYTIPYARHEHGPGTEMRHLVFALFPSLMIFGISTSATITGQWFDNEKQIKEMENQKLQAELAFLKAQVNPHFLFNMLNNIYTLAYKKSDATADAVMKLSHLMRYMIYESNVPLISLEKEVEYLQNYIDLQKMRLSKDIDVIFSIEGEIENKMISPMLLVPFVENAFKHGVSYVGNSPISINIKVKEDNALLVEVENHINRTSKPGKEPDSGIGLQNTRRRLELLYPGKYHLDIKDDNETYKVILLINIS